MTGVAEDLIPTANMKIMSTFNLPVEHSVCFSVHDFKVQKGTRLVGLCLSKYSTMFMHVYTGMLFTPVHTYAAHMFRYDHFLTSNFPCVTRSYSTTTKNTRNTSNTINTPGCLAESLGESRSCKTLILQNQNGKAQFSRNGGIKLT